MKPAKTQAPPPGSIAYDPTQPLAVQRRAITHISDVRAKSVGRVFETACAMDTLGNLLQDSGGMDEGDQIGAGWLLKILGEQMMAAYADLRFLEDGGRTAVKGGAR